MTWRWPDLVPMQFHRVSGVKHHDFRTSIPYSRPGDMSVAVEIVDDLSRKSFLVARNIDPNLFEAVRLVGSISGETNRELRYLTVHKAHEVLIGSPALDARAIRHSLAHASTELRDPAVIASLTSRFGSTRVDFHSYAHKREIFKWLGRMVVALDIAIRDRLLERHNQLFLSTGLASDLADG